MQRKSALIVFLSLLLVQAVRAEPVWVTQQGARLVIGQPSFTRQSPTSSRTILGAVGGVAIAGDRLFAVDSNRVGAQPIRNRVLIYERLSSFIPALDANLNQAGACPVCVGVPEVVLGQKDFETFSPSILNGLQTPTAVASDGTTLAVADTNNNRVLIWHSIPTMNGQPPDVVVGQPDTETIKPATSREGLRGPQGVWIDSGRLFIADTQNSRVLIYNSIPRSNGAPADIVLGEPDFDTRPEPDLTQSNVSPAANTMLDPVSVTVNNGRLFVSDLGFNRVLIFLTVPTQNTAPADIVIGQPDMESGLSNNSAELCEPLPAVEPDENADDAEPQFPRRCEATLTFPRFALSDGTRLFIADGGNDRILIFNEIPMTNGAAADVVLGQPDFQSLVESDGAGSVRAPTALAHDGTNLYVADPFTRRILVFTPAEDMIVQDGVRNGASFEIHAVASVQFAGSVTADNEVTVGFTSLDPSIPAADYTYTTVEGDNALSVRDALVAMINSDPEGPVIAAPLISGGVHAVAEITFAGEAQAGDTVTLQIADRVYRATLQPGDPVERIVDRLIFFIDRAADPNVLAERSPRGLNILLLTALEVGPAGNSIAVKASLSPGAKMTATPPDTALSGGDFDRGIQFAAAREGTSGNNVQVDVNAGASGLTLTTSGSRFTGGSDARELPPGSLAVLFGEGLAEGFFEADANADRLPTELGGVQVFTNGVLSPLFSVTPQQINFQVPWEIQGTSISVYVRRTMSDGNVMVSAPRANRSTRAAPGLFTFPGPGVLPRQGVVLHGAAQAQGQVALSKPGVTSPTENEPVTAGVDVFITVQDRTYKYVTQEGDTLVSVRDALVNLINEANDPAVAASAGVTGFFSARADVEFTGEIQAGDIATITVRDRRYFYVVQEGDSLAVVRNILVQRINEGRGDPEVTARRLEEVGAVKLQVVARDLGDSGNSIPFFVGTSANAAITVETNVENDTLEGGQTPPVVILTARQGGREGNLVSYTTISGNTAQLQTTARGQTLCCGNTPFSLVDDSNPAIPGETIIVFGSGLGLTAPLPASEGLVSGRPTPSAPLFNVPFVADDFVSSIAGGRTAQVQFVGLMPGFVGVYQLNLKLNEDLPDNPETALTIAQQFFVSNVITFPVKNLTPKNRAL